ncbi:MAG: hypothetical protein ACRCSF_05150 [Mycobacteriaceae bacterium]
MNVALARTQLMERQHEILGALLGGSIPEGFDVETTTLVGNQLRIRRRNQILAVTPWLDELQNWWEFFDDFSRHNYQASCAHEDSHNFLDYLRRQPSAKNFMMYKDVFEGRRSIAVLVSNRRRQLVVGCRKRVYRFALRSRAEER